MTVGGICVVRNEERWVYYALKSISRYVDNFVIIDNMSTDRTPYEIGRARLEFSRKEGTVKDLRNEAAKLTGCDWIWWIDGDEVWCENSADVVMKSITKYNDDSSVSILNTQLYRFIDDRFHYDGRIYRMPRIYRNADVKMYGQSFPRAIDALARQEDDLKQFVGKHTTEVRVEEPYIVDIDATFYHYAECNTLLDRKRKWYGYIKGSNPDASSSKLLDMLDQQVWGVNSDKMVFKGIQPEVFD